LPAIKLMLLIFSAIVVVWGIASIICVN
jgi:hypothetical protein